MKEIFKYLDPHLIIFYVERSGSNSLELVEARVEALAKTRVLKKIEETRLVEDLKLVDACKEAHDEIIKLAEILKKPSEEYPFEQGKKYAHLLFDTGDYVKSKEVLRQLQSKLATSNSVDLSDRLSVHWGLLSTGILTDDFSQAVYSATALKDLLDGKTSFDNLQLLTQRTWLLHWTLFALFGNDQGKEQLILDLYMSPVYINTIQTVCPHLLLHVLAMALASSNRNQAVQELSKVLSMEKQQYSNALTRLILKVCVEYDFDKIFDNYPEIKHLICTNFFLNRGKERVINGLVNFVYSHYSRVFSSHCVEQFVQECKEKCGIELQMKHQDLPSPADGTNKALRELDERSNVLEVKLQ